jgi:predicted esterase
MRSAFVPPREGRGHVKIGGENAETTVIFLHGSGGGHDDLARDLEDILSPDFLFKTQFIFPLAKERRYTLFGGEPLPVWFDRTSVDKNCEEDMDGLEWTARSVRELARELKRQNEGIKQIFIAGFSQGGCAALYSGYKFLGAFENEENIPDEEQLFHGIICMSSFLCDSAFMKIPIQSTEKQLPLCFTSNRRDAVVPEPLSQRTLEVFQNSQSFEMIRVRSQCGQGGHWVNSDCLQEMCAFIDSLRG